MTAHGLDPRALTDLELLRGSLPKRTLRAVTCLAFAVGAMGLGAGLGMAAVYVPESRGWLLGALLAGLVLPMLVTALVGRGNGRRPKPEPHRAELLRRHRGSEGADADVLFLGIGFLPSTDHRAAWVVLRAPPSSAWTALRAEPQPWGWVGHARPAASPDEAIVREAWLSREDSTRLGDALAAVRSEADGHEPFAVIDGAPFDLEIHRRGPAEPLVLSGNLCDPGCQAAPLGRLVSAILEVTDREEAGVALHGELGRRTSAIDRTPLRGPEDA